MGGWSVRPRTVDKVVFTMVSSRDKEMKKVGMVAQARGSQESEETANRGAWMRLRERRHRGIGGEKRNRLGGEDADEAGGDEAGDSRHCILKHARLLSFEWRVQYRSDSRACRASNDTQLRPNPRDSL